MSTTHNKKLNSIETAAIFNKSFKQEYLRWTESIEEQLIHQEDENKQWSHCLPGKCLLDRNKYTYADYFIKSELSSARLDELRDTVFDQLYPLIRFSTSSQIGFIVRSLIKSISNQILHHQIESFDTLMDIGFLDLLVSAKQITLESAMDKTLVGQMLENIPKERNGIDIKYMHDEGSALACKVTLWQPKEKALDYDSVIEEEFEATTTVLK